MTDKMIAVPKELLEELRECAEICADDVRAHDLGEDSAETHFRQVGRACDALLREAPQPAAPVQKAQKEYSRDAERSEPVKVRPETDSEHIARDIREGRFPEKSDRKMVSADPVKVPTVSKLCGIRKENTMTEKMIDTNSLSYQIGAIGNRIHNIGSEHQNDKDLSERLGAIAYELWVIALKTNPHNGEQGGE